MLVIKGTKQKKVHPHFNIIAKANFEQKKAAAEAEIRRRINSISTPEQLEKMYKVYGSSYPDLFEKRMSVYSEDHSDKSTRMKRKYYRLSRGLE